MSSTSTSTAEAALRTSGSGSRTSVVATLMVVVLGTWLGVAGAGGFLYYLVSSGRMSLGAAMQSSRPKGKTSSIALEPILVNLADAGGHAFVRLGLRVDLDDDGGADAASSAGTAAGETSPETAKTAGSQTGGQTSGQSELESSIRDTVLTVLGRQTSSELLGPDGKEHLKIELHEAIERGGVRVRVKDLFFTDFVVQI